MKAVDNLVDKPRTHDPQTACRALCTLRAGPPSEPAALLLRACVGLLLGTPLPDTPPAEEQVAVQDLCGVLKHHDRLGESLLSAVLTALIALAQVGTRPL